MIDKFTSFGITAEKATEKSVSLYFIKKFKLTLKK